MYVPKPPHLQRGIYQCYTLYPSLLSRFYSRSNTKACMGQSMKFLKWYRLIYGNTGVVFL